MRAALVTWTPPQSPHLPIPSHWGSGFRHMNMLLCGHAVVSDSLQPHGLEPTRLLCPWDSPDKNAGVGCHFLLQGIFLTQGLNLDSLPTELQGKLSRLGTPSTTMNHWQCNRLLENHKDVREKKELRQDWVTRFISYMRPLLQGWKRLLFQLL